MATHATNRDIADACEKAAAGISYNDVAQGQAKHMLHEAAGRLRRIRAVNADQVAWMLAAIGRHIPADGLAAVSRAREMQKYALLYEIMEVAGLVFEDDAAAGNATPGDVQRLRFKPSGPLSVGQENCAAMGQQASGKVIGGCISSRI